MLAAAGLVRPGGLLVYSVCTLTAAEPPGVDEVGPPAPELERAPGPRRAVGALGSGGPAAAQAAGTDGMALPRYGMPA